MVIILFRDAEGEFCRLVDQCKFKAWLWLRAKVPNFSFSLYFAALDYDISALAVKLVELEELLWCYLHLVCVDACSYFDLVEWENGSIWKRHKH